MCSCIGGCSCSSNSTALPIGPKGDTGTTGPAGATGATGATGAAGSNSPFFGLFVTPETYGAIGDGTTDDSVAIQAMVNSGIGCFIPEKSYKVTTSISVPSNTSIIGSGRNSIISTTSNITIFNITGDEVSISNMSFVGSSSGAAQIGIGISGNAGFTLYRQSVKLLDITFSNCNYAGYYTTFVVGGVAGNPHAGGATLTQCVAKGCGIGFFCDVRGEYNMFIGCSAYSCTTGVQTNGGNNTWVGGNIVDNTTGFSLGTGTNDGHATMVGTKIHHNTNSVVIANLANGYEFTGCTIAVGDMSITSSTRVRFNACYINVTNIVVTTSTVIKFTDNIFITNPTFTITGTSPTFFGDTWLVGAPSGIFNTLGIGEVNNHTSFAFNATGTIASADLSCGYITSTSAAAVGLTLPTATLLAGLLGATAGSTFDFIVDNTLGANVVTVIVGGGITAATPVITGGATLTVSVANAIGLFRIVFSSATVAKLYRIG